MAKLPTPLCLHSYHMESWNDNTVSLYFEFTKEYLFEDENKMFILRFCSWILVDTFFLRVLHVRIPFDLEMNVLATYTVLLTWCNKLVYFHHHCSGSEFSPALINGFTFNEAPCFAYLLGLEFTPDLRWNSYIQSITNSTTTRSTRFLLSCFIITRVKWCGIAVTFRLGLHSPYFSAL